MDEHVTSGAHSDLSERASTGMRWSVAAQLLTRGANVLTTLVLARIIDKEDFGVWAAASAAILVVLSVNDIGLPTALIRWPGDIRRPARTALTITLVMSTLLAICAWFGASTLARAVGKPSAGVLVRWLVLAIAIDSLAGVPSAELAREFRQDRRLVADLAAVPVSFTVTITLALSGIGPLALAAGFICGSVTTLILLNLLVPYRVRPGFDRDDARQLLRVGIPLASAALLTTVILNIDNVIVGRELGAAALGAYYLAFNISNWMINLLTVPVSRVSISLFARVQEEPARLTSAFRTFLYALVGVGTPIALVLSVCARPLVAVLYGTKWSQAATPLAFLAFFGLARVIEELLLDLLVGIGLVRRLMVVRLVWLTALVPALIFGARAKGLAGVGLAQLLVAFGIVVPVTLFGVARSVSLRAAADFLPKFILAATSAAAAWWIVHGALQTSSPVRLVVEGLVIMAVFFTVAGSELPRLVARALVPTSLAARLSPGHDAGKRT